MSDPNDPTIPVSCEDVQPQPKKFSATISPIVTALLNLYDKRDKAEESSAYKTFRSGDGAIFSDAHLEAIEQDYQAEEALKSIELEIFSLERELTKMLPKSMTTYLLTNTNSQYGAHTDDGIRYFISASDSAYLEDRLTVHRESRKQ